MKQKNFSWDYLWYALYAFAGLGVEMVLLGLLEPVLFGGISSGEYSAVQTITHWLLTILCWGMIAAFLIRSSRKKLQFDIMAETRFSPKGLVMSAVLVIFCIALNAYDWGTLKIVGEFQKKELILFIFQYIYYLFEITLVFLIVAFGQKFFEAIIKKKSRIPWGGLVLCCTWGAIHIVSRGSISAGIGVMIFSLVYGIIYLLLERNTKYAYAAMAIAFMV